jgi:hypothetical protein
MKTSAPRRQKRSGKATAATAPASTRAVRTVAGPVPSALAHALRRVIAYQWRVNLGECAALLTAAVPALWLFQALADYAFDLPWLVRACLLCGDAGVAAYLLAVYAIGPWRRRLTLSTAALLVERKIPEYRSALISAVQLAQEPSGSPALARVLIARVSSQLQSEHVAGRVVETAELKRWSKWAVGCLVATIAAFLLAAPASHILLARVFLSRQALPTRTVVIPISGNATIAVGADLPLGARAAGVIPRSGRLLLAYASDKQDEMIVQPQADDPAIFAVTLKSVQQSFSYHFELNDGVGTTFRVTAQVPPAMASCKFVQSYPAYTRLQPTEMSAGNLSFLAGSHIRVEGRATQALRSATLQFEGASQPAARLAIIGADKRTVSGDFAVPAAGLTGFSMQLMNADGVVSTENTVYHVEFAPDRPPVVELKAPAAEHSTITATTQPKLQFSVRDDFGVKQVTLRYAVQRPVKADAAAADAGEVRLPIPPTVTSYQGEYVWDLTKLRLPLPVGSTVSFWIEAADNNDVTGPGIGQSARKTLEILSEAQKRAELLDRLGASASVIEELYQNERAANEELNTTIHQGVHQP